MVEGPQCNLKSKKLAGLVGQRVRRCSDASLAAKLHAAGAVLRVVAVGKECFVVFERLALRLHYAMAGSQCVRDVSSKPQPLPAGSRKRLTLALELDTLAVDLYDCGRPSIRTLNYLASVESRAGRDVIAEPREFDRRAVVEKLHADTRPAYDALMDQVSFPGVGNVIKCEALHEAAVSPTILLSELPEARLVLLVTMARAFAQRWHEACRRGVGIAKRVYGRTCTACACGAQISLIRAGEKNRITYYCPRCQSREASLTPAIARGRGGSLLGWLQPKDTNVAAAPRGAAVYGDADAAGGAKAEGARIEQNRLAALRKRELAQRKKQQQAPPPQGAQGVRHDVCVVAGAEWACGACTLLNSAQDRRCQACRAPHPEAAAATVAARKRPAAAQPASIANKRPALRPASAAAAASEAAGGGVRLAAPRCKCGIPTKLQRVRKPGPNHGRLFWSCPKRQAQSCKGAFLWADAPFPHCACCTKGCTKKKKKAILRRVLKPGATNGRYFFSCAVAPSGPGRPGKGNGKGNGKCNGGGCGFFSWENNHAACWDKHAPPIEIPL